MKYSMSPIDFKSIKEMPAEERPREKIHALGPSSLSDLELLCCMLGSGGRERPVQDIANDILNAVTLSENVSYKSLESIAGLGEAKASVIGASLEFGRRFTAVRKKHFNSPQMLYDLIKHYGFRDQEHLITILLNGAFEVMSINVITVGLVNRTMVHPREVFSEAIKQKATAIVIAHNHPSGVLDPSDDDFEVTQTLVRAGHLLGIKVLDHIIFDMNDYLSMAEKGFVVNT